MKKSDNDATYGKMLLTQLKANSKNPKDSKESSLETVKK